MTSRKLLSKWLLTDTFDITGCLFTKYIRFCFFFLLFCPPALLGSNIFFESESVYVDIRLPDTVSVHGSYLFVNQSTDSVSTTILYPFPVDSMMNFPFSTKVNRAGSTKEIPYSNTHNGIIFASEVGAKDSARYFINYLQKVKNNSGRYILTTTKEWGKPLRYSALSVTIPSDKLLKFVSYDADTVFSNGNKLVYRFFFKNFMPVKDLLFNW